MRFKCLLFILLLVFLPIASWADTHTAASCSIADVTAAYNAASAGDIVAIPAGSSAWNDTLIIQKEITITGAGTDLTTIINGGVTKLIEIDLSSDVPVRITGIYFDHLTNDRTYKHSIYITGKKDGSFALTQLRIDHNTFDKGLNSVFALGWIEGVIDSNTFINCDVGVLVVGDSNHSWSRAIEAGTSHALFIEDNTFIITNDADYEPNEQIYQQDGARTVTRHNTFDGSAYTDGNTVPFDSHGNQNYYTGSGDFRGQPIIEVYENTFSAYKSYDIVHFRGGSIIAWNNTLTCNTGSPRVFKLIDEESWQTLMFDPLATVWNAEDQIMNSFFWGNTYNGEAITDVTLGHENDATFIQKDRDYFMHAPQNTGGKATYTGRAGGAESFSSSGANAYYPYTPYIYPHPLRKPSPPQNWQFSP